MTILLAYLIIIGILVCIACAVYCFVKIGRSIRAILQNNAEMIEICDRMNERVDKHYARMQARLQREIDEIDAELEELSK